MLNKIIDIAIEAGNIVMQVRKKGFSTKAKKDPYDLVTTADEKAEEYIIKRLSKEFPNDSILSEERGLIAKDPNRIWMVDPLDGTKYFANKRSGFSVMIGLCEKNIPLLGVIYAPARGLLYYAEKSTFAFFSIIQ